MKFVSGFVQPKTLNDIQIVLSTEFKNPNSESR
jgi:hypothetical protein